MTQEPLQIRYIHHGAAHAIDQAPSTGKVYSPTRNFVAACEMAGISPADARSQNRERTVSLKRFHVMAIMRSWGRSLPAIGRLMNRDHTTILHGLRRWTALQCGEGVYHPRPDAPIERYVTWVNKRGKWAVYLQRNAPIGFYSDFAEAVAARDAALRSHVEAA